MPDFFRKAVGFLQPFLGFLCYNRAIERGTKMLFGREYMPEGAGVGLWLGSYYWIYAAFCAIQFTM